MESFYGTSRRITALAPFGAKFLSGLLRRPVFVAGEATVKAVAVNAWQWAEENKAPIIQLHKVSYSKFKRGEFKGKEAKEKLKREVEKAVQLDTIRNKIRKKGGAFLREKGEAAKILYGTTGFLSYGTYTGALQEQAPTDAK